jgi:hypothetical protein
MAVFCLGPNGNLLRCGHIKRWNQRDQRIVFYLFRHPSIPILFLDSIEASGDRGDQVHKYGTSARITIIAPNEASYLEMMNYAEAMNVVITQL